MESDTKATSATADTATPATTDATGAADGWVPHAERAAAMADEARVVWAPGFDPASARYVREVVSEHEGRRVGRVRWNGREVGWTELRPGAPRRGSFFHRRVFWLAAHDPYEGSGAPVEAVDPLTVAPGRPGVLTERAWGRPFDPPAPAGPAVDGARTDE
ncbi:MAG TPA: DUF6009 family protein [Humisphaera sp.]